MINLNERMLPDRSRELTPSWSPVERAPTELPSPANPYVLAMLHLVTLYISLPGLYVNKFLWNVVDSFIMLGHMHFTEKKNGYSSF